MPITINATDPTIEVEETDEDQVVDVSIKPKGLYIDEKVEEDIVEDDGGGDDEKTKKPKKTKETNKIIKKLENGFDISIEEAELLKGAGYSYYQPTADDATTEGKIDLYEKITVGGLMHNASDIIHYEKDSAEVILNKFKMSGAWNLVVLKNDKYFGFISKSRLLTAYRRKLIDVTA